jgi:hypothetical protein
VIAVDAAEIHDGMQGTFMKSERAMTVAVQQAALAMIWTALWLFHLHDNV